MTTWDWFALSYPRVCHSLVYSAIIDNFCALGFVVSVPLKQSRRNDLMSRAEIAFERDILYGDFFDRVCARMDLNLEEAILGYKFDADAKRTIVRATLPSALNVMNASALGKLVQLVTASRLTYIMKDESIQ